MYQHDVEVFRKRVEAFGWHAQVVDGHNINELIMAFDVASKVKGQPSCILAKTFKGKYFPSKLFPFGIIFWLFTLVFN